MGSKTAKLLRRKNIYTIFDLLWNLPRDFVDRTDNKKINELQIGKIQTVTVNVKKYNFPRKRNLPNKVLCEDDTGKLDCVFFNSYEGYIKKILPLNQKIVISGKIGYFKERYQITNPTHLASDINSIKKVFSNYSLTEGLNQKIYSKLIQQVLKNIPDLDEWLSERILKKFNYISWKQSVIQLHDPKNIKKKGKYLDRLIFDEIFSTFLINSNIRKSVKKIKKKTKLFGSQPYEEIKKKLNFDLTKDQIKAINEINNDLKSDQKMFRLLQGDVGSGKTIVALVACMNVISSSFQTSIMAPTEILANQHFNLAKDLLDKNVRVNF